MTSSPRRPACRVGDHIVVLDRGRSRYFLADPCRADGSDGFELASIAPDAPERDADDSSFGPASTPRTSRLQSLRRFYRLHRLEEACARIMRHGGIDAGLMLLERSATGAPKPKEAALMIDAARRSHLWWSGKDRCLPRSIALASELRRCGSQARLVIGVALDPFAAHAWVQDGDTVLNDAVDHVRLFTPLLAL